LLTSLEFHQWIKGSLFTEKYCTILESKIQLPEGEMLV